MEESFLVSVMPSFLIGKDFPVPTKVNLKWKRTIHIKEKK